MNVDERIAELTQKMLRRKFYAVLSQPSETPEKLKALLPAHLEYMIGLEKRGVLFASGPLADGEEERARLFGKQVAESSLKN